ncbi:hypothetical protein EYF80_024523 [Liparis tanakae]|uniref:Uncharacterized protein n=1 Tax=Liparis tanakae TaxID=230148 RepID=A0A4Z2HJY6_9TELE|nr:hypothetical protein EYF80_024523 [Liparis tanakae]
MDSLEAVWRGGRRRPQGAARRLGCLGCLGCLGPEEKQALLPDLVPYAQRVVRVEAAAVLVVVYSKLYFPTLRRTHASLFYRGSLTCHG